MSTIRICEKSVSVQISHNEKGKRNWDKKQYCLYCEKAYPKLPRHLAQKHSSESEVAQFLSYQKGSTKRKLLIKQLTNKGNFHHNINVLESGKGVIVPRKRPQEADKMMAQHYSPCEYCLGFFVSSELWKHQKLCPLNSNRKDGVKNRNVKARSALLLPVAENISASLRNILENMNQDDVARLICRDQLILKYGKKLMKVGKEQHNRHFIAQKMRELGRLLKKVKEIDANVSSLIDIIKPSQFNNVISAVRAITGFDTQTETYAIPSLGVKLGAALKKCAKIVKADAMKERNDCLQNQAVDFDELCNMEWTDEISAVARKNLDDRKYSKPAMIPLVEDIVKLQNYLKEKATNCMKALDKQPSTDIWYELSKTVLCQIILFNRRRSGEASRIKTSNYVDMGKEYNEDVHNALSKLEQALCNFLHRFVIRGKRDRKVPVLLTKDMKTAVDCLLKYRNKVDVLPENSYLFAIPNSENCSRASDCLRKFAQDCGAKYPTTITSTRLRKHIAILSQLFCLKDNELDILAKFMGHDIRIHREFYRLPEDILQMAKVGKVLLGMEQGKIKDMKGKSLDEMNIDFTSKC